MLMKNKVMKNGKIYGKHMAMVMKNGDEKYGDEKYGDEKYGDLYIYI